jgi:hypothetical protein
VREVHYQILSNTKEIQDIEILIENLVREGPMESRFIDRKIKWILREQIVSEIGPDGSQ